MKFRTYSEMEKELDNLKKYFDIVRIVDPINTHIYASTDAQGAASRGHECYDVWGRECRCEDCSSALALMEHERRSKIEILGADVYYIVSHYAKCEEKEYIIEMVMKMDRQSAGQIQDKSMLYQKIAELDHNVTIDELTGVYNRYYIAHILPCKLMEAVYTEQRFGFAMLDIDDLKKVNDTWGHQAGDHFIRTIIKCVSENLNANDAVCRYGGDEFLIFMKVAKREEFKQKIGEMLSRIRTLKIKTVAMMPSVSIGGVFYGEIVPAEASLHTLENYIAKADQRLYQAKKSKAMVCFE